MIWTGRTVAEGPRGRLCLVRLFSRLVDQGVTPELDPALRKRIRLTNALALFAAFVMFASIPFDWVTAPRWMLVEDVVGGVRSWPAAAEPVAGG